MAGASSTTRDGTKLLINVSHVDGHLLPLKESATFYRESSAAQCSGAAEVAVAFRAVAVSSLLGFSPFLEKPGASLHHHLQTPFDPAPFSLLTLLFLQASSLQALFLSLSTHFSFPLCFFFFSCSQPNPPATAPPAFISTSYRITARLGEYNEAFPLQLQTLPSPVCQDFKTNP